MRTTNQNFKLFKKFSAHQFISFHKQYQHPPSGGACWHASEKSTKQNWIVRNDHLMGIGSIRTLRCTLAESRQAGSNCRSWNRLRNRSWLTGWLPRPRCQEAAMSAKSPAPVLPLTKVKGYTVFVIFFCYSTLGLLKPISSRVRKK
jgi:hypothetical protein